MKLVIPAVIWQTAISALREPPHDRERVVYLDGHRAQSSVAITTTVTIPNAVTHEGHFAVSAREMSRAGKHLRRLNLIRLAQIHSHPASFTGHSPHDDENAFSQRDDAISIIAPHYAGCAPGLSDCGIHIREPRGWRELSPAEKTAVVQIVPSFIDLRT